MKKTLKILAVIAVAATLTAGCGKDSEKSSEDKLLTCTLEKSETTSGISYKINSTYKVYYNDDNIVNKAVTKESISSDNDIYLDALKTQLDQTYKTMNDAAGGYKYSVTKKDGAVTADVTIDYGKMNLKDLAAISPDVKALLNDDNKMTLDGLRKSYEAQGATCK